MNTKEKKGNIIAFIIALIACMVVFVNPVHAAELQSQVDNNTDAIVDNQESDTEDIIGPALDNGDSVDKTASENTIEEGQEEVVLEEEKQLSTTIEIATSSECIQVHEEPTEDLGANRNTELETDFVADDAGSVLESKDDNKKETIFIDSEESTLSLSNNTEESGKEETEEVIIPYARPVKDGTYIIVSKIDGFKALQTAEASNDDGKQIELYDCDGSTTQKFKLFSDEATGYYTITNAKSGKAIAVKNDSKAAGTLIVQNNISDSLGQKWILVEKDGYYMIQSALDGSPLLLTLRNGSIAKGSDAILEEAKDAASQLFSFLISKPSVTINDGVYEISSALDSNMKCDILGANMGDKGNLQIYKSNGTNAQRFIISKTSGNQYTITSYNSGKAVDLNTASKAVKTNVQQYTPNGSAAQKWTIRNVGDGTLYITSVVSGLPLEVQNGKASNNANIFVNKSTGSKAQRFTFTKIDDSRVQPIANGVYLIHSRKNNNRVIAVEDGSRLQRANIQLQYNDNASFQKFRFTYAGKGYYKIQNVKSKHMIDLQNASYANTTNIQQWNDNGTLAQLWLPHKNTDGTFTFISAKSGRVLDAAGGSMADATNIWAYSFNNSDAQKFTLTKTSGSDSTAINYGTLNVDSVLSAMFKKAQDYSSATNYLVLCNITKHRLVLFKESEGRWLSVMDSPISVGKASTPTPTGTFTVYNHWEYFDGDYKESQLTYQCWWSTCFYGSYYFHSVLYDYNSGYPGRLRDGRMNVNVSHGCVRMPLEKAKYLYDHSPIGTKVRVYK